MMSNAFVIKGDICHSTEQDRLETVEGGHLVCEEGRCAGLFRELPERFAPLPALDFGRSLILPGLVDLHVHAPQYAFRGLGMDLELLDWLERRVFPEEARYRDLEYAERAYARFVEDLVRGPNTRAVIFATCHTPATLLLMDMLEASGLVTLVGKVNMDRHCPDNLREADAESSIRDTVLWLETVAGRYRNTAPILTPRFIPSCSDSLLDRLGELRRQHGLPVQSHLSENRKESAWVAELSPLSSCYADAYRRSGLLGGDTPTVMAHCVWSDEEELRLLREQEVYIAHCPQSNMNLASGIAPARRFLRLGIPTGLGSDVAGGCHMSVFRAMSDAVQVSKLRWRLMAEDEPPLTLEEAFALGTTGGGAFFSRAGLGRCGGFSPGSEFDALVLNDESLAAVEGLSLADRLARVVYFFEQRIIRAKFVRGRRII